MMIVNIHIMEREREREAAGGLTGSQSKKMSNAIGLETHK